MQLFETPIPGCNDTNGHKLQDFLIGRVADGRIEKQLREFFLHSCYRPAEIRARLHDRKDRSYRMVVKEGFAGTVRPGWIIEVEPKATGIALLIFPDDVQYGEHSSKRAFMERHARFLVVRDRHITQLMPINILDS